MSNFVIVTDSSADLPAGLVQELDVEVLPLSFTVQEKTYHNYPDNRELDPGEFYRLLRAQALATTAAVNVAAYTELLEPALEAGKDVLILAFSSGLSATYQSSSIAVEELREKFPQRKIFTVDTLCATLGQGLLISLAAKERAAGKSVEEVRDWAEANKLRVCHWITVDDLTFLKRGGRISAATSVVGSMLHIKPIIRVDDEGRLNTFGKARGRAAALTTLVDQMAKTALDPEHQTVFISHGDCLEDAQKVAADIKARFGTQSFVLNTIGPVIGAHAGPGTVALCFLGTPR